MRRWLLVGALACLGCGSGDELATEPPAGDFDYAFTDPRGDTLATDVSPAYRAIDVIAIAATLTADELVIQVRFAGPVQPWSARRSNSVDGFIDLDVDEDPETGLPGAADEVGGQAQLGADFYVSLRDNGTGNMAVVDASTDEFRLVPVTFGTDRFEVRVPREFVQEDDGQLRIGAVLGVPGRPVTDYVPNAGNYAIRQRD